jgi:hypothetical protein
MTETGRVRKAIKTTCVAAAAVFAGIQLVPYGRDHSNPPRVKEPSWEQPSTRALAVRACFDCHSNETQWPWYSGIAPISWLLQRHVDEGRRELNFSEWQRAYEESGESAESVLEGEMPPWDYVILHPAARLSAAEKRALAQGLTASLGSRARHDD